MTRFDVIKQEISKMDNPIDLMAIMCVITYRFRKDNPEYSKYNDSRFFVEFNNWLLEQAPEKPVDRYCEEVIMTMERLLNICKDYCDRAVSSLDFNGIINQKEKTNE